VPPVVDAPPKTRRLPVVLGLAVLGGAALAAYLVFFRSTPADVTDSDNMFSARFPNPPEESTVSEANPMGLRWGERLYRARAGGKEYKVSVLDGVNAGDQEYGPLSRDTQANEALVIMLTDDDGTKLAERTMPHEGHVAHEMAYVRKDDGRLTAARAVVGEHQILRLSVTGSGDKDKPTEFLDQAAEFFNTVHVGPAFGPPITEDPPAVTAAELNAAYKTDPKAADARYKGKWLRVTGKVKAVADGGTSFKMDAGTSVIQILRAPPARRTVRVQAGQTATMTGKCRGREPAETEPRVILDESIVIHPARLK
jgi:hypothetical protein